MQDRERGLGMGHLRIDAIADPADQAATVGFDRARRQARVVDAAQTQSDHQHDGKIQRMRERSMALWERQAPVIGPEMMNAVTAELKRIRAN